MAERPKGVGDSEDFFEALRALGERPPVFEPGEPLFWNDPHISAQMLDAHLDPEKDAASRRPETIDRTCDWLVGHLGLRPGERVLDLGCGPGLYATRLARKGLRVTGIDCSKRSIEYACGQASAQNLYIDYRCDDYLTQEYIRDESSERFDLVTMIYCDFAVLSDDQVGNLLGRVRRALRPGGKFVFDVFTPVQHSVKETTSWTFAQAGFWRPHPHLSLYRKYHYPEADTFLDQYLIVDQDLSVKVYRIWDRVFTPESIRDLLRAHGFDICEVWADLLGQPYFKGTKTLGVVASPLER